VTNPTSPAERSNMQLTSPHADDRGLTSPLAAGIRQARVIVVGLLPMEGEIGDLVEAGGAGFSGRQVSFEEFLQTARLVADGVAVLPPELTAALLRGITGRPVAARAEELQTTAQLTQRERQVMELIGAGFSNKEIAIRLRVAVHTVKTHVHNVLSKLSLGTRLEVAALLHSGKYRPAETITSVA
jgi:DNA-binding NarL/FixJ family response regulator